MSRVEDLVGHQEQLVITSGYEKSLAGLKIPLITVETLPYLKK